MRKSVDNRTKWNTLKMIPAFSEFRFCEHTIGFSIFFQKRLWNPLEYFNSKMAGDFQILPPPVNLAINFLFNWYFIYSKEPLGSLRFGTEHDEIAQNSMSQCETYMKKHLVVKFCLKTCFLSCLKSRHTRSRFDLEQSMEKWHKIRCPSVID